LVCAVCAWLLAAVPACSRDRDARTAIEFWAMGREGEVVQQLVPGFEARHPGIRVRVQQIPWSAAHEKILTSFAGDAMPDVVQLGNTWIAELVAIDALEPLDERIAADAPGLRDDVFPGVLDAATIEGRVFALPWYVDTRLLFYRSDLLTRAGVAEAPRDWAAWVEAMQRVRSVAGPGAHAILLPLTEWETPVILALQRGSSLLRDRDGRGDFQAAPFRAAFAFYLDLFARGLAPRGGEAQATSLYQGFAEGSFSFVVTGPWNLGEMRHRLPATLSDAWATAAMPAPEAAGWPGLSLAGGASLAVTRASPHQDAAWQWIAYLAEPEQQLAFHRASGDLPASRRAWHDGGIARDPRAAAFATQLERVQPPPKIPEWERIAARIAQHAEAAVRGYETQDAALAALDAEADRILEKRRWMMQRDGGAPVAEGDAATRAAEGAP
jgi:multiple sugar transport system substrate-binding protein